jgi:hypothetical protein
MTFKIKGKIIDKVTVKPIKGVKISISPTLSVFTKSEGDFILEGSTNTTEKIKITISLQGYTPVDITPYYGDGEIKEDIGVIQLDPIQKSLDQDKIDAQAPTDKELKDLTKGAKSSSSFLQKRISNSIVNVKSRLIPVIITLIAAFGVTKVSKLIAEGKTTINDIKNQTKCPTPDELTKLIKRKNKLVKQINNLLKVIKSVENTTKRFKKLINTLKKLLPTLDIASMALPTSVPPGIGIPSGAIIKLGDLIKFSKDSITMNQGKIDNLNSPLSLLKSSLATALQYLKVLDTLVQHCAESQGSQGSQESQEQISAELIALTTEQSNQESPVVTNVNGFEMGVETEPTISTLSVKRRRAIAKNKQGIIMLTGEWSFSSIDQILIDELVFYIQTNDLRAD